MHVSTTDHLARTRTEQLRVEQVTNHIRVLYLDVCVQRLTADVMQRTGIVGTHLTPHGTAPLIIVLEKRGGGQRL